MTETQSIVTRETLDALPSSAIILDSRNCPWQKWRVTAEAIDWTGDLWVTFGMSESVTTERLAHRYGPLTILTERTGERDRRFLDMSIVGLPVKDQP